MQEAGNTGPSAFQNIQSKPSGCLGQKGVRQPEVELPWQIRRDKRYQENQKRTGGFIAKPATTGRFLREGEGGEKARTAVL